ncbi:MAG: endonuclease/exonuclease/phosphatase family protein [Phycisphaerae bacterium]|nr:endonuclease/exonuclease/phosphatase family protein [Phycisphaerae bacterium]
MRITSYNILDGGEGRADPIAEILLAQRADIVCLVEADNAAVRQRIASRLKMDMIVGSAGRDSVALLSRLPIVETIDHAAAQPEFTGSLLEAIVVDERDVEWPVGVVHLSAKATEERERKREAEIAVVIDAFARHRQANRPHFLAGDFNANSPTQIIDPAPCKPATREAWESNGRQIPRRVIQRLLDAGYTDTLRAVHGAAADEMVSFTTHWPGQRLDYIFAYAVGATDAWIERDRLATYASDHYPVGCVLLPAENQA